VLGRYVRERGALGLEEAIAKMTSAPADRVRLPNRGRLEQGYAADVVVLDAQIVRDNATFENPAQAPTGIRDVIVNGVPVVMAGHQTNARPGRVLRASDA
jgi:N-acyl-D-aspartate/D-glutamate deacylase